MTAHNATAFGTLLRHYRLAASLSQEALAERAGLSGSAIAALETGRRTTPRLDTVSLLADALGLSSADRAALMAALAPSAQVDTVAPALSPAAHTRPAAGLPGPGSVTALFGRERDAAAVAHLLVREGSTRLVTLTGPGGVGKTCLALAVATALSASYPDGVAFVDLSALGDPNLIAPTIARGLGLREDGARDVRDLLRAVLQPKKLLLVLDNFEQVVEGALLVAELAAACSHLAVLVTSRIALQVRAEQRFAVSPLAVPDPGQRSVADIAHCAAVRLFVARARAVQPDFNLSTMNAPAVAEICRRLDGLPLALELAAARIMLLPPTELLRRLGRRLGILTHGARDVPARQQTLRATIDWSYALLTPEEQTLLRRASVFVGGATLEAVEVICAAEGPDDVPDVLGGVASLVDKSLLRTDGQAQPRVGMLETVREYAGEQLEAAAEAAQVRQAHATYYLALAEQAEPHLRGAAQALWLQRLTDEHDNLRAALHWALEHDETALGWRLGGALWRFWYLHGHIGEGRGWLERLLVRGADGGQADLALARARVLGGAGVFAELQGDYTGAQALHEESLAIRHRYGDTWGVADSLDDLGVLADSQGDVERAATLYAQAQALFGELGDAWGTALVLSNQGYLAREQGAYAEAAALHEQSLTLFREVGDERNIAFTLNNLGEVLCDQGDYARAQALCEESLAVRRSVGDPWGVAISTGSLGRVAQAQGAYERAAALYEESLAIFRDLSATWNMACILDDLSILACKQGAYVRAESLSAESLALFREIQDAKGAARTLTGAAQIARAQGDLGGAERLCRESLAVYRELGALVGVIACLECLAQVLCASQAGPFIAARVERGVQLWGATAALRDARGTPRSPDDRVAYDDSIAPAREAMGTAAFAAAWAKGSALSVKQAIDLALTEEAERTVRP